MKPRTFTIRGTENEQTAIRNNCMKFVDEANLEHGEIQVTISLHEENRRTAQNRLMWLFNGQIGQAIGESPDYAHGMSKLDVLLPMGLADETLHKRSAFVQEVLGHVVKRSHKIAVSYDMIRTKDLSVKQFAAYLNTVDQHYAKQGIVLVSPEDLRSQALYESTRQAA